MTLIHGITVKLYNRRQVGIDKGNRPIYEETPEDVENVLVGEPTTEEITNTLTLTGKRGQYWLGIPKGDTRQWENRNVELPEPFTGKYRTIGFAIAGIESLVPLSWNKKIMVERYE